MTLKSDALQADAESPGLGIAGRLVVIGEPTGGRPAAYGDVTAFTLPRSGLDGQYSTEFVSSPPGIPDLPSFLPDVPVITRSSDFFARYDPVFGAMLARRSRTPPAPSGTCSP